MDEWQLLRQYVEDDSQEAFADLVKHYINLVYSTCLREVRDPTLAEDATQVVFVILAQKAKKIRRGTVLSGWLYRTARLVARDALKQEARRQNYEQQAAVEMIREIMHDMAPDKEAGWQQVEPLLHEALDSLSPRERHAVLLRYFEGKSVEETGDALNISAAAARMRIERALDKMRRYFTQHGFMVSGAVLGGLLTENAVQAAPAHFVAATVKLASVAALHSVTAEVIGAKVFALCQNAMRTMLINKSSVAVGMVLSVGLAGAGIGQLTGFSMASSPQQVAINTLASRGKATKPRTTLHHAPISSGVAVPFTAVSAPSVSAKGMSTKRAALRMRSSTMPRHALQEPQNTGTNHAQSRSPVYRVERRVPSHPIRNVSLIRQTASPLADHTLAASKKAHATPVRVRAAESSAIEMQGLTASVAKRASLQRLEAPLPEIPPMRSVPRTVAEVIPDLPLEQTVDGVTMQIAGAAFKDAQLSVQHKVVAAPDVMAPGQLSNVHLASSLYNPDGMLIERGAVNFVRVGAGPPEIEQGRMIFSHVNPSWPFVTVDYQLMLPGAPPGAGGWFQEEVEFKDVTLPTELNVELPINQVVETKRGTKIILRSVKAVTKEDAQGGVTGWLRFTLSTAYAPGSLVTEVLTGIVSAVDTAGRWDSGPPNGVSSNSPVQSLPLPPGTVKSLNLKMNVSETARELRDRRWFRDFRFKIKLPPITDEVVVANKLPDAAARQTQASNPSVSAVAENTSGGAATDRSWNGLNWNEAATNTFWSGNIWLKDQLQPPDANRFWFLESATATDAASGQHLITEGMRRGVLSGFRDDSILGRNYYNPAYWKTSGEPLAPNERYDPVTLRSENGQTANKINIEAKLIAARRLYTQAHFTGLPALKVGEEVDVNRTIRSPDGALLTLTTMRHLTRPAEQDLTPRATGYATWEQGRPSLIELTFKYTPIEKNFDLLRLDVAQARDNQGRELSTYQPNGRFPKEREGQFPKQRETSWIVTVQDLPAGATNFDIQFFVAEFTATGQSTTVTFRDVPVSPPLPSETR